MELLGARIAVAREGASGARDRMRLAGLTGPLEAPSGAIDRGPGLCGAAQIAAQIVDAGFDEQLGDVRVVDHAAKVGARRRSHIGIGGPCWRRRMPILRGAEPSLAASAAAWRRDRTPSLPSTAETWCATVLGVM